MKNEAENAERKLDSKDKEHTRMLASSKSTFYNTILSAFELSHFNSRMLLRNKQMLWTLVPLSFLLFLNGFSFGLYEKPRDPFSLMIQDYPNVWILRKLYLCLWKNYSIISLDEEGQEHLVIERQKCQTQMTYKHVDCHNKISHV